MPKSGRLTLWRNAIHLFHEQVRPHFVGPFKKLGFRYRVEARFLSRKAEDLKPDITASGKTGWVVLDLSNNPSPKDEKLRAYKGIDPRDLAQYGLEPHTGPPDTFSCRLAYFDDGPNCELVVRNQLEVHNSDLLSNRELQEALNESAGVDLRLLPSIPISLLPEMRGSEIREGLVDTVMQLFDPTSTGKTLMEIVDQGLERLSEAVGPADKSALARKVQAEMNYLIRDHLHGYLDFSNGTYRPTQRWTEHHKTREFLTAKLREWLGQKSRIAGLEQWWIPPQPDRSEA